MKLTIVQPLCEAYKKGPIVRRLSPRRYCAGKDAQVTIEPVLYHGTAHLQLIRWMTSGMDMVCLSTTSSPVAAARFADYSYESTNPLNHDDRIFLSNRAGRSIMISQPQIPLSKIECEGARKGIVTQSLVLFDRDRLLATPGFVPAIEPDDPNNGMQFYQDSNREHAISFSDTVIAALSSTREGRIVTLNFEVFNADLWKENFSVGFYPYRGINYYYIEDISAKDCFFWHNLARMYFGN